MKFQEYVNISTRYEKENKIVGKYGWTENDKYGLLILDKEYKKMMKDIVDHVKDEKFAKYMNNPGRYLYYFAKRFDSGLLGISDVHDDRSILDV